MEDKIHIKTDDNHLIYGTLNWQNPMPKKLIIFVHGLTGNQNKNILFNGARFFTKKNFIYKKK